MLRQLFTVLRGTALAQLIGVVILPLLTRLFAPEAFGHLQVYQSILTVLVIIGAFRLELILLRTPDGETRIAIQTAFLASLILSGAIAAVIAAGLLVGWPDLLTEAPFSPFLLVAALIVAALTQTYTYWLTRERRFSNIVRLKLVQATIYAIVAVSIGLTFRALDGLIYADIGGRLASAAYVVVLARRESVALVRLSGLREQLTFGWKHRRLPMTSAPGALLNAAGIAITPLMVFSHYGAAQSGQFGLVERSASLPIAMVVTAISQVYVAQLANLLRARDRGAIRHMNQITVAVAALALVGAAVVGPMIPWLFTFAFGSNWLLASVLGQIMLPAYAIQLVAGALNQSLIAMGCYGRQLCWDAGWPIVIGSAWIVVLSLRLPLEAAIALHSASVSILGLLFVGLAHWSVRRYFAEGKAPTPRSETFAPGQRP